MMHASYGELFRIANECVRGLGIPYGQAEDVVDALVWTQAVLDAGYETLKLSDAVRPVGGWPHHSVRETGAGYQLHLSGQPLLLLAPRIADLAVVQVAQQGTINISVADTHGGAVSAYIVSRLANADIRAIAIWKPKSPVETETSAHVVWSQGAQLHLAEIGAGARLPDRMAEIGNDGATADLTLLALADDEHPAGLFHAGAVPVEIDPAERLRRIIMEGYAVTAERHAVLSELANRLRIPSSERSRGQAG